MIDTIKIHDQEFLPVKLMEVSQRGSSFFVASINAKQFIDIYTVKPTEYNVKIYKELAKTYKDDREYYNYLIDEIEGEEYPDAFQREESENKLNEIKRFLESDNLPLFPNSVIVTCDVAVDFTELEAGRTALEYFEDYQLKAPFCYLESNEGDGLAYTLYIPYEAETLVIIDGQHRVKGLEKLDDEYLENYEILVSFVLGYDKSDIAKLFYTINSKQKPVNKSLIYQLMGQFSRGVGNIAFLHSVVRILNETDGSPFSERIKMLGVVPKGYDGDKKYLSVSQSFLIDYLQPMVGKRLTRSIYQPIFRYFYNDDDLRYMIPVFIMRYFKAVVTLVGQDQWDSPREHMISKTVGVGALLKVMQLVFVKMLLDDCDGNAERLIDLEEDAIAEVMRGIEGFNFSVDGDFGKSSSSGQVNKLRDELTSRLAFLHSEDKEPTEVFKEKYLDNFKDWFTDNAIN